MEKGGWICENILCSDHVNGLSADESDLGHMLRYMLSMQRTSANRPACTSVRRTQDSQNEGNSATSALYA